MKLGILACLAVAYASPVTAQGNAGNASDRSKARNAPVQGCWRTDRPLGPTGGEEPVPRDSLFRTVVLQDSGHIAFPLVPARQQSMWVRRSYWYSRGGDSLTVRHFTGLQGWNALLVRAPSGDSMHGTATYLSDAIVVGREPDRVTVSFTRIDCEAGWPGTGSSTPAR